MKKISGFLSLRSLWPDDFGDEQNEIDVILTIFYESLKRNLNTTSSFSTIVFHQFDRFEYFHLGLLVILQQNPSIAEVCNRLYELNLKFLTSTPDSL